MLNQLRRVGQHATLYATVRQELLAQSLASVLGEYQWKLDLQQHRLAFTSAQGTVWMRARALASIAIKPASLVWGYSPMLQRPDHAQVAEWIRQVGQQASLPVLLQEEVPYMPAPGQTPALAAAQLADNVGEVLIELFGADCAYYSAPVTEAGSRLVLLLDQSQPALPPVTLADFFARAPRLLPQVDDIAWSLEGLARLTGWQTSHQRQGNVELLRVADQSGAWCTLQVTRDLSGRVVDIQGNGIHQS